MLNPVKIFQEEDLSLFISELDQFSSTVDTKTYNKVSGKKFSAYEVPLPSIVRSDAFYKALSEFCKSQGLQDFILPRIARVKKYSEGDFMGWHYDHQKMTRNMSTIVICLQEAEEGGDFEMKGQPSIKLKTGEAILFPSGPPNQHRSKEVLKGIKYSVNILISHKENVL